MGRKVSSSLSFVVIRKTDNKEYTVNGKVDKKSKTGVSYQILNPYFGEPGAFKFEKKWISLGSNAAEAKQKASNIVDKAVSLVDSTKKQPDKKKLSKREQKYDYSGVVLNPPIKRVLYVRTGIKTSHIISTFIKHEKTRALDGEIKFSTYKSNKGYAQEIDRFFANQSPEMFTTENITKHIDIVKSQSSRSAQIYVNIYERILAVAKVKGLVDFRVSNPALDLLKVKHVVQRSRCDEESFNDVQNLYTDNELVYKLTNMLGLVTKVREMDLVLIRNKKGTDWEQRVKRYEENKNLGLSRRLKFSDYQKYAPYSFLDDDKQELVVYQLKTSNIIRIPYSHKIGEEYLTVGKAIEKIQSHCKKKSEYLIHHPKRVGVAKLGTPLHPNTVSRKFTEKVRSLKTNWLNKKPPTWHELRSLSIRIEDEYRELQLTAETQKQKSEDNNFAKARNSSSTPNKLVENSPSATQSTSMAAGHASNSVTAFYQKSRGIAGSLIKGIVRRVTNSRISATT